jgi:hypothetical protein
MELTVRTTIPLWRLGAAAAVLGLMVALPASAFAQSSTPLMTITGTNSGYTLVSEQTLSDGLAVTTWQNGTQAVSFAGLPGSTVSFSESDSGPNTAGEATATITPPASGNDLSLTQTEAARLEYEEAVAVHTPTDIASAMAFDVSNTSTEKRIFHSACAHTTGDANHAWGTACITQKMAQNVEPNGVYVLDKIHTSGSDHDWACDLTGLRGQDFYRYSGSSGEHGMVDWHPDATVGVGNPRTYTASVSYNGVGFTVSQNVYPNRLDPVLSAYNGSSPTSFADFWSGDAGNGSNASTVAAPGVDEAHIWSRGSKRAGVSVYIRWGSCI